MNIIENLQNGTADAADVYEALGWEVRPHRRMVKARMDGSRCISLDRVTSNAGDALSLIGDDCREEAVRAASALIGPFGPYRWGSCPIARRICVIALTRPDLRNPRAVPEGC